MSQLIWLPEYHCDLFVVGGGITGCGVALDAATRGLKVLLVEKGDFAAGTSSKTTKLNHRGLRYLADGELAVTWESIRECLIQQEINPTMVWAMPFVLPRYSGSFLQGAKYAAALWISDLMTLGSRSTCRFHGRLSRRQVMACCPGIRSNGLVNSLVYYDWRTDDARQTLEVAQAARRFGAQALNYWRVESFLRQDGRITGAVIVDELSARRDGVRKARRVIADQVVLATGVWTGKVSDLAGITSSFKIAPAKGVHITMSPRRLPIQSALLVPTSDGRFCFAFPWYDSVIVGTTDTPYDGDLDAVTAEPREIQYILAALNQLFPTANFTPRDVTGKFAGLRPLISAAGGGSTAQLSRRHTVCETPEGVIQIAGGKLTTYRCMAEDTVDHITGGFARRGRKLGPCRTQDIRLCGWRRSTNVDRAKAEIHATARELGLGKDVAEYLVTAYGYNALAVLELCRDRPEMRRPIVNGHPQIMAQVIYACHCEQASTLDDMLTRRTRLAITDADGALAAAGEVASVMAEELGWDATFREWNIDQFHRQLQ